jgi:predicted nuclease of restriction endonuclease-like RecB superfamily
MLTGELVRASVKDGTVKPGFISLDKPSVRERAGQVIACIDGSVGQRRGDIDAELKHLLGDGVDQKLFVGLAKLVFDQCTFATQSPLPPRELRQLVWRESARRGPLSVVDVEGANTASSVYAAVAAAIGADPATLPDALYADHPDEQRLTAASAFTPETLVARYNLALVQALLFSAAHVDVRLGSPTPADSRQLLRAVKFHQLCFAATREGGDLCLRLDGPASLFSQTTRYGLSLARFLPSLVLHPRWSLRATVEVKRWKPTLEIDQGTGLVSHARDVGRYETREAEWFAERFLALDSGWALERDPLPLNQGGEGVVVPDFTFRKGRKVAHLEILGFWRKGTVERRLALLKKHGPSNLVLAVSRRYCTEKAADLPDQVVSFAEVIPARHVLEAVERVARSG